MSQRKAIEELERIVEADPANRSLWQKIGELYQKEGNSVRAADAFARVADLLETEGFFLKAAAMYKQVARLSPSRTGVHLKLAALYLQLGLVNESDSAARIALLDAERVRDTVSALKALQILAITHPERPDTQLHLAEVLRAAGRDDEAADAQHAAVKLLRIADQDLAVRAEQGDLLVRRELAQRESMDRALRSLSFENPN